MRMNMGDIELKIYFLKTLSMVFCTFYTFMKITNNKEKLIKGNVKTNIILFTGIITVSVLATIIKSKSNTFMSIITIIFLLSFLISDNINESFGYIMLSIIISLSANEILLFCVVVFTFIINVFCVIKNDYINLAIMICTQIVLLYILLKFKRIKNGISFLNKTSKDGNFELIILNISVCILFSVIIFSNMDNNLIVSKSLFFGFIIFSLMMFTTIQKSIQLYYKQKLLIQDLTETKSELEKSKQEIQTLEKENIELSKKNHSFNHKYKSLKHKLDEILLGNEIAEEIDLKKQIDSLSKEIYIAPKNIELTKTGIPEVDDMLKFLQSECDEHKITFNLQVIGNIYHMINNFISQEELEILIADHIKDAIIAINHSDNINKSILVKLGKIEDCYGLYIYDSGIEFEKETLEKLGKEPITTHINEGGSGMGFMNTFDTLRRHNASLIIEELGKPCKDNFTKIIKFQFDDKNDFKVISYRNGKNTQNFV